MTQHHLSDEISGEIRDSSSNQPHQTSNKIRSSTPSARESSGRSRQSRHFHHTALPAKQDAKKAGIRKDYHRQHQLHAMRAVNSLLRAQQTRYQPRSAYRKAPPSHPIPPRKAGRPEVAVQLTTGPGWSSRRSEALSGQAGCFFLLEHIVSHVVMTCSVF